MTAYYNDHDPSAAEWLRELIKAGAIPDGYVDERSILDVRADDLDEFTQCHFFAGIGGWPLALRLAGWPDDRPVWTGSPPCQPFSVAGEGRGSADERHLSPKFIGLVRDGRPEVLFGEQVASAAVFGKAAKSSRKRIAEAPEWAWLDDLSDRLEAARYAVGASDIPSAGVGAPHIRQRTFFGAYDLGLAASWVADAPSKQREFESNIRPARVLGTHVQPTKRGDGLGNLGTTSDWVADSAGSGLSERPDETGVARRIERPERFCDIGRVGDASGARGAAGIPEQTERQEGIAEVFDDGSNRLPRPDEGRHVADRMADSDGDGCSKAGRRVAATGSDGVVRNSALVGVADAGRTVLQSGLRSGNDAGATGPAEREAQELQRSRVGDRNRRPDGDPGPTNSFWRDADWLFCRDGKWRPVEPGTFPLADGVSGRVGLLRGYGNAINPWAAKVFIEAFEEARTECFRLDRLSSLTNDTTGIFG